MNNKYIKKDILLKRKNLSFFTEKEGESYATLETYKAKAQLHLVMNGLKSSKRLNLQGAAYHLIFQRINGAEKEAVSLGKILVDEKGQTNVIKKIDLNQFEKIHGPIWESEKLLVAVVYEEEDSKVVLEGILKEKGDDEVALWEYCHAIIKQEASRQQPFSPFGKDETKAKWYRVNQLEGCPKDISKYMAKGQRYGHFLLGQGEERIYIAIPGRFMASEEVSFVEDQATLWQPLKGAEPLCQRPEEMKEEERKYIYGYWIGQIDQGEGKIANC